MRPDNPRPTHPTGRGTRPVHRILDLVPEPAPRLRGCSIEEARAVLLGDDPQRVRELGGSFALVARRGEIVRMARSLDRPLRYFLAKEAAGPLLVVADRIDTIRRALTAEGYGDQFHPTYTRMVPAHHVTELRLIGCPDPNPVHRRFFAPPRGTGSTDLDVLGRAYVGALRQEVTAWLDTVDDAEPIGVPFSGGVDSGAVLLVLHHVLLSRGQAPQRLKAFTLQIGADGPDARQAREFLRAVGLEYLGETIEVERREVDPIAAVRLIEDYKPLDVECAAVASALLRGIRERYPTWRLLADGDGGDENLKDYPIESNAELTIRSVVQNSMLYQEGWGVDAIKHSPTYSGGQSRACVRTYAPSRELGFESFSPFTSPGVIEIAESIPFAKLTGGSHERLYGLKGQIVSRGVRALTGVEMPVFEKRRFQHGAAGETDRRRLFGRGEPAYRAHFLGLWN